MARMIRCWGKISERRSPALVTFCKKHGDQELQKQVALKCLASMEAEILRSFPGWKRISKDLRKMGYLEFPASTRFHLSIGSGLMIHSVGVTLHMLRLVEQTEQKIPRWKILVAGLIHDCGKCGVLNFETGELSPRFTFVASSDRRFKFNATFPYFDLRDLSGLYAARWGLPWDIIQAVLIHDGSYVSSNNPYAHRQCPLSMLLTTADTWVGQTEETQDFSFQVDLKIKNRRTSRRR